MKFLVVDDELVSRKKMETILGVFGDSVAVDNGTAALGEIEQALDAGQSFDLVTLDVSMPGMDGTEVLIEIRALEERRGIPAEKRTRVVMVTGHSEKDTVISAIRAGCDSYVMKPFDRATMSARLEELGLQIPEVPSEHSSIRIMVMDTIDHFNKGRIDLPVFPEITREVEAVLNSPAAGMKELAAVIEKDSVISVRVLATANSTFYRGMERVHDLQTAISRLGGREIQNIVSVIVTSNLYRSSNRLCGELLKKLWLHSLCCAYCCRAIALRLGDRESDKVFMMGLVHNIGTALLLRSIGDMVKESILFSKQELMETLLDVHSGFGAAILSDMGFGEDFVDVVRFYKWTSFTDKTSRSVLMVNLAERIATSMGYGFFEQQAEQSPSESAGLLGIDEESVALVAQEVRKGMDDADLIFG